MLRLDDCFQRCFPAQTWQTAPDIFQAHSLIISPTFRASTGPRVFGARWKKGARGAGERLALLHGQWQVGQDLLQGRRESLQSGSPRGCQQLRTLLVIASSLNSCDLILALCLKVRQPGKQISGSEFTETDPVSLINSSRAAFRPCWARALTGRRSPRGDAAPFLGSSPFWTI